MKSISPLVRRYLGPGRCVLVIELVAQMRRASRENGKTWVRFPSRKIETVSCLSFVRRISTGRRIGLSLITTRSPVRVRPPEPFWPCASTRGSSVVEHVNSQFVSYPSVFKRAVDCGLSRTRQWRFNATPRSIPWCCNASIFRWAEVMGYRRLPVRVRPAPPNGAVVQW